MAPSPVHIINAITRFLKGNTVDHSLGLLNATISLREGSASLILIDDNAPMVESVIELIAKAEELGVPVVTMVDGASLGALFGSTSMSHASVNGGNEHLKDVVAVINEAIATKEAAPARAV